MFDNNQFYYLLSSNEVHNLYLNRPYVKFKLKINNKRVNQNKNNERMVEAI